MRNLFNQDIKEISSSETTAHHSLKSLFTRLYLNNSNSNPRLLPHRKLRLLPCPPTLLPRQAPLRALNLSIQLEHLQLLPKAVHLLPLLQPRKRLRPATLSTTLRAASPENQSSTTTTAWEAKAALEVQETKDLVSITRESSMSSKVQETLGNSINPRLRLLRLALL
jgi:hypothetical protein